MAKKPAFRDELIARTAAAFAELTTVIGDETLYAFALYTSGEDELSYVCASGNTEQRLGETQEARWSAPDWHYHDFSAGMSELELPKGSSSKRDAAIYEGMVAALSAVRVPNGVTKLIVCGDMSDEFFRRGLERLNPKTLVDAYLRDYTPDAFFESPAMQDVSVLIELWRDLTLERSSELVEAAKRVGATSYDVEQRIVAFGSPAVAGLIELIEAYAMAAGLMPKGAQRAFNLEADLASSAAFMIAECGRLSPAERARVQRVIGERVAADSKLSICSTVAENLARVLHRLQPGRFPATQLDPNTNHLRNPDPFLRDGS